MRHPWQWLFSFFASSVLLVVAACSDPATAPTSARGTPRASTALAPGAFFCPDAASGYFNFADNIPSSIAYGELFSGYGGFVKVPGTDVPARGEFLPQARYQILGGPLVQFVSADGQYVASMSGFSASCGFTVGPNGPTGQFFLVQAFDYHVSVKGTGGGTNDPPPGCDYQLLNDGTVCNDPGPGTGGPGSPSNPPPPDTTVTPPQSPPPSGTGPGGGGSPTDVCSQYALEPGCYDVYIDGAYDGTVCC